MPDRVPRHSLEGFCRACSAGDLELLEALLDREDPINGFQGDINEHHVSYNALHYAAANGQLECVEALLNVGADPHVRTRLPRGRDPADGLTAAELAEDAGWEDIGALLRAAEAKVPRGDYLLGGPFNNAKIYPSTLAATGREFEAVRRVSKQLRGLQRPYFRERLELDASLGLLFPGQGSQRVGMLGRAAELPAVAALLQRARQVLGWDLAEACLQGPAARLEAPEVLEPAMYVAGAAALERLRGKSPGAAEGPGAVAGFGAGELVALLAAGVLSFEDGLLLARARGEALKEAAATGPPQALLSVAGLRRSKLEGMCKALQDEAGVGAVCAVSHELFPKGATCGGTRELIERLQQLVKEQGALQAKLVECGAFHTSLMAPARERLRAALEEVAPRLRPPRCDVYVNCTGRPVFAGTSPRALLPLLLRQITEPIRWESCVRGMIQAGVSDFYELGPMQQLKAMMKRIDAEAFERTSNVEV